MERDYIGSNNMKQSGLGKNDSIKRKSIDGEQATAKRLGGQVQPMSGKLPGYKGDIKLDDFLLDEKRTEGASIKVDIAMLMKINREAFNEKKEPGLVLTFSRIADMVEKQWMLIPVSVFERMVLSDEG
jgi:hypothetical protein